jgi:glycerol kinase
VVRPVVTETTALGAAYLAGLATSVWKGPEEIARQRQIERAFDPTMPKARAAEFKARWTSALERAKGWETA